MHIKVYRIIPPLSSLKRGVGGELHIKVYRIIPPLSSLKRGAGGELRRM